MGSLANDSFYAGVDVGIVEPFSLITPGGTMKAVRQQAASDWELHEYLIEDIYPVRHHKRHSWLCHPNHKGNIFSKPPWSCLLRSSLGLFVLLGKWW